MKRYLYEPGVMSCGETEVVHVIESVDEEGNVDKVDRDTENVDLFAEGYLVFDSRRGRSDDLAIAFCRDHDFAQKIVDALNAAEAPA